MRPGPFGRHIGEGTGDGLEEFERLPLAWETACNSEPGEPGATGYAIYYYVGRFDVFVNKAAIM